ncbi:hypothetical protein [Amycolatopsis sp. cmx-11-12]|uniref:hypothetical protein n=1 Tax=Amycolatopsis sp. cmx-11-12 TaxID=2785795 RepID=UPI00391753ED
MAVISPIAAPHLTTTLADHGQVLASGIDAALGQMPGLARAEIIRLPGGYTRR